MYHLAEKWSEKALILTENWSGKTSVLTENWSGKALILTENACKKCQCRSILHYETFFDVKARRVEKQCQ